MILRTGPAGNFNGVASAVGRRGANAMGLRFMLVVCVALFALASCDSGSGGSGSGDCGMCATMGNKCEWDAESVDECRTKCEAAQYFPVKCEAEYTALMQCFQNEDNWSCTSSRGLVGCDAAQDAFDSCRIGSWESTELLPSTVRAVVTLPADSDHVWVGTGEYGSGCGVYRSDDAGETWEDISGNLPNFDVTALAVNPTDTDQIYAAVGNRLFRTDDGGQTWQQRGGTVTDARDLIQLYLATDDGLRIYALAEEDGFIVSEDGGETWTLGNNGLPIQSYGSFETLTSQTFAVDPADAQTIYIGTGAKHLSNGANGVFKSTDGGQTWQAANAGMLDRAIFQVTVASSGQVYAVADAADMSMSNGSLFVSNDGGATWEDVTDGDVMPEDGYEHAGVLLDPQNDNTPYIVQDSLGLLSKTGELWQTIVRVPDGEEMSILNVLGVAWLDRESPVLLVATEGGGLWRYVWER